MGEPDRNLSMGQVLREEARYASANSQPEVAQDAISKLERYAAITRDLIVENNYESARGFALFAQGDFANAVDELTTDPHSPIALQQLALGYDKLNAAAEAPDDSNAPEVSALSDRRVVSRDASNCPPQNPRLPRRLPQPNKI